MSHSVLPGAPSANALPTLNTPSLPSANAIPTPQAPAVQELPLGDLVPLPPAATDVYAPASAQPALNAAPPANALPAANALPPQPGANFAPDAFAPSANYGRPANNAGLPPELMANQGPRPVQTMDAPTAQSSGGLGMGNLLAAAAGGAGAWFGLIPRFFASASTLAKGGIVGAAALGATMLFGMLKNKMSGPKPAGQVMPQSLPPQGMPANNAQFAPQGLPANNAGLPPQGEIPLPSQTPQFAEQFQ